MTTYYRIARYGSGTIEKIEVIKETPQYVTLAPVDGCPSRRAIREQKNLHYPLHATFAEAKAQLVDRCTAAVVRAEEQLLKAHENLARAERLTEPQ
jgi:hypothetical protein